jgi:hypothetical protein
LLNPHPGMFDLGMMLLADIVVPDGLSILTQQG